jgi:hypothetical protein
MNSISETPRDALADIVQRIVDRLYLDLNPPGCPAELCDREVYNPDKVWDPDDLAFVAELLQAEDLIPEFLGDVPGNA